LFQFSATTSRSEKLIRITSSNSLNHEEGDGPPAAWKRATAKPDLQPLPQMKLLGAIVVTAEDAAGTLPIRPKGTTLSFLDGGVAVGLHLDGDE
jgi:hypothetical protein